MVAQTITLDGTAYALTFQDEFTGTDTSAWEGHGSNGRWNTSFSPHLDDTRYIPANGEGQYYVDVDTPGLPQSITQQGGILSIQAHELTTAEQALADGQEYASGLLTTELTFGASGGYMEVSAMVPDQQGFLSSFWLLPADGDWSSEIDVFEILGHDTETSHTNLWDNGVGDSEAIATTDLSNGFHTYGLHWTDSEITWYIDGVEVRTEANTVTEDMYLAFSLAVDTTWTGRPDGTTDFNDTFQIDYVRVYEEVGNPNSNASIPGDNSFTPHEVHGGTAGDDTLYGSRWGDLMEGEVGNDTVYGRDGDDSIEGGDGDDKLFGQKDDDILFGDAGNDSLIGGLGGDRLEGGAGTDHLWGGKWAADAASDIFVHGAGDGQDFIHDFETNTDMIDISSYFTNWTAVQGAMTDEGWATKVDLTTLGGTTGDTIVILDVAMADLDQDDFMFGVAV